MARRATLIDTLRKETPNLLLYDAGMLANDQPDIGEATTAFILRALGKLGYSAFTLGSRDLRYPLDLYRTGGRPRLILSNVIDAETGACAADRYVVDEVDGVRVGAFSLMWPPPPVFSFNPLEGYEIREPEAVASQIIAELREQGVEVIVLLSQLGRGDADDLLARHPEIDVVIMGHESTPFTGRPDPWEAATLYGTARGQAVASVVLTVAPDGSTVAGKPAMHDLPGWTAFQPEMAALVESAEAEIMALRDAANLKRYREAEEAVTGGKQYMGAAACESCHQPEHIEWMDSAHAGAYDTLVRLGMQQSSECLSCHTVGYGDPDGYGAAETPVLTGVQCESCHGRGSAHVTDPTTATADAAACVICHDDANSPDFDADAYMEKIRHW